jgi:hypothetical protein
MASSSSAIPSEPPPDYTEVVQQQSLNHNKPYNPYGQSSEPLHHQPSHHLAPQSLIQNQEPYTSASILPPTSNTLSSAKESWSSLLQCNAWGSLFYLVCVTFPFGLFSFCWVAITATLSLALLIIFPIGYPLLVLSALSWRALARTEVILLDTFVPNSQSHSSISGRPGCQRVFPEGSLFHTAGKNVLCDSYTWIAVVYFVVVKLWVSTILFCMGLLLLCILPFSMCCCPFVMLLVKEAAEIESKVVSTILNR